MTYTPFHVHEAPAHPAPIKRKQSLSGATIILVTVALVSVAAGVILLLLKQV